MVRISGARVINVPIKIGNYFKELQYAESHGTWAAPCSIPGWQQTPAEAQKKGSPAERLPGSSPILPSMCSTREGTLLLQSCSSAGWTLYCSTLSRRRAAVPRQSPAYGCEDTTWEFGGENKVLV